MSARKLGGDFWSLGLILKYFREDFLAKELRFSYK